MSKFERIRVEMISNIENQKRAFSIVFTSIAKINKVLVFEVEFFPNSK